MNLSLSLFKMLVGITSTIHSTWHKLCLIHACGMGEYKEQQEALLKLNPFNPEPVTFSTTLQEIVLFILCTELYEVLMINS